MDRFVRLLRTPGSRRSAVGALLGVSAFGAVSSALGKRRGKGKDKNGRDRNRGKERGKRHGKERGKRRGKDRGGNSTPQQAASGGGAVAAEANCGRLGRGSNLNNCNFNGRDLDGFDLSGSSMKNTTFNNASLCGANLSDSTLTNAEFNGANLTKATLNASACKGLKTNRATRFCRTPLCNGSVDNSDCPVGVDPCCQDGDCPPRACHSVLRNQNVSACVYTRNTTGATGTQCPSPRQCCDGVCCEAGQKCCGGRCIANDECCIDGKAGCPDSAAMGASASSVSAHRELRPGGSVRPLRFRHSRT